MTAHTYKLLLVAPAGRAGAANAWVRQHLDPAGSDWLVPSLSAAGEPPATHAACCFHATPAQAELLAAELSLPRFDVTGFTGYEPAEQAAVLAHFADALHAATGLLLGMAFNAPGAAPDAAAALAALSLRPAATPLGKFPAP